MVKKNQRGFALIETILMLVAVLILASAGWYVWHTSKNTDKTLDATTQQLETKIVGSSPGNKKALSPRPVQKYLTIKEWGVRAPYDGPLTLEYVQYNVGGTIEPNVMALSSAQMAAKSSDQVCKNTDNGEAGSLSRLRPNATNFADGVPTNETAQAYVAQGRVPYAKIGNYLYIYFGYQKDDSYNGPCDKLTSEQTMSAFSAIVPKLQTIPK